MTTGWIPFPAFTDEFSGGPDIDRSKWEVYDKCHGMSPAAYFKDSRDNVWISNDQLHLKAKQDDHLTCTADSITYEMDYSSGFVRSKYQIQYGYLEFSCSFPSEMKLNPSIWIEGSRWENGVFVEKDEIDVMEYLRNIPVNNEFTQNFGHNMYLADQKGQNKNIVFDQPIVNHDLVFGVEWLPNEIHFYINGRISESVRYTTNLDWVDKKIPSASNFTCIDLLYALPQRILLSLSLMKANADLSGDFKINYVRSYKLQEGEPGVYWPKSFSLTNPDMFKVHQSIKLGGDQMHSAIIAPGNDITLWASDCIIMDKGFTVLPGGQFVARTILTDAQLYNITTPLP
jgi:beta-glucanase (GH16 family)